MNTNNKRKRCCEGPTTPRVSARRHWRSIFLMAACLLWLPSLVTQLKGQSFAYEVDWDSKVVVCMAACDECGFGAYEEVDFDSPSEIQLIIDDFEGDYSDNYLCSDCGRCNESRNSECYEDHHCSICRSCIDDDYHDAIYDLLGDKVCFDCYDGIAERYPEAACHWCHEMYGHGVEECGCTTWLINHCTDCSEVQCELCGSCMVIAGEETDLCDGGCMEHNICGACLEDFNEPDGVHCIDCHNCDQDLCSDCGLCESCYADQEHCPECDHCFGYGNDIEWCKDGGEHCVECCADNEWICEACRECVEGTGKNMCPDCGNCDECCLEYSEDEGCTHGYCVQSGEFDDHLCPECQQCPDDTECEYCGMCADCQADYHCQHELCPEGSEWDDHLCPDCGDCFEEDELCEYCGKCESCREHCEHDFCPEFDDEGEHFICEQCSDCFEASDRCDDCGLCQTCCEANTADKGCEHELCVESTAFADHWCYQDDQCLDRCSHDEACPHSSVSTDWLSNGEAHWHVCDDCGAALDKAIHSEGTPVTIVEPNPETRQNGTASVSCDVCSTFMNNVTLPYVPIPADGSPYIITQPKDYEGKVSTINWGPGPETEANRHATFKVRARGKNLSYQWYQQLGNGTPVAITDDDNLEGTQTATLTTWVYTDACLNPDYQKYYCVVSNASGSVKTNTVYVKAQHVFGRYEWIDGEKHGYFCLGECSYEKKQSKHRFGEWQLIRPATSEQTGLQEQKCMDCNYKNSKTIAKVEPGHVHSFDQVRRSPAEHWFVCKCGVPSTDPKAAHTWGTPVVTEPATEKRTGKQVTRCTVCDYGKEETIDKLPHTHVWWSLGDNGMWVDEVISESPRITKPVPNPEKWGWSAVQHYFYCKECDQMNAEKHVWSGYWISEMPADGKQGKLVRECDLCYYREYMSFAKDTWPIMMMNGKASPRAAKAGDVVTITFDTNTSKREGKPVKFKQWVDNKSMFGNYSIYDGTPGVYLQALPELADANSPTTTFTMPAGPVSIYGVFEDCHHTGTTHQGERKEASCTGYGHEPDEICDDCGTVVTPGARIEALGHDLPSTPIAGTKVVEYCTLWRPAYPNRYDNPQTHGYSGDFKCNRCDKTVKGKKTPLEHGWYDKFGRYSTPYKLWKDTYWEDQKEATCTSDGSTGNEYCRYCLQLINRSEKEPRTGHDWGEWEEIREATPNVKGMEQRVCGNDASHTETRITDFSGPDYTLKANKTKLVFEWTYGDAEIVPQTVTFSSVGRNTVTAINDAEVDGVGFQQSADGLKLTVSISPNDALENLNSTGKIKGRLISVVTPEGETEDFTAPQIAVGFNMKKTTAKYKLTVEGGTAILSGKAKAEMEVRGGETLQLGVNPDRAADFIRWEVVSDASGLVTQQFTDANGWQNGAFQFLMSPNDVTLRAVYEMHEAGIAYEVSEVEGQHGEDFTAPKLINPNYVKVTYSSSDESVATVDAQTGAVVCTGEGTVTITATFEGNDIYHPATASYVIKVARHNGTEISEENFPDEAFRQFVADQTDLDGDGWLEDEEIEAVKEIDVHGLGIADLKGIEHFSELEMLFCYENELTTLDVSMLAKLRGLYCFTNLLSELDVTQNPLLQYFYCYNNQLTDIDVSKNPGLLILDCAQNQLTKLDVSQNPKLEQLSCYLNQIKDAEMDALIASLSRATDATLRVIAPDVEGEQNVMTKEQVAAAKQKGWTAYYWTGTTMTEGAWAVYAGSDTPTGIGAIDNSQLTIDSWYTLDGKKLAGEPKKKGVYIRNGRKVVK